MTNPHPKATISAGGTGLGLALVTVLGVFGVTLDPEAAVVVAGGISAGLLVIGQDGLAGIWNTVMHGRAKTPPGDGSNDANVGGGGG